ncbi:hypothetical protein C8J56DRAFT_1069915 [Mycena floridula]|nr:hypothetical protein C8J56DRAFT_1069915 [Mycena floridula]
MNINGKTLPVHVQVETIEKINWHSRILKSICACLLLLVGLHGLCDYRSKSEIIAEAEDPAYDIRLDAYHPADAEFCAKWPNENHDSVVTFNFPLDFDLLFFSSGGEPTSGHIEVVKVAAAEDIRVNITANYAEQSGRETTLVCRTVHDNEKNEHGVLIWTSFPSLGTVSINITVEVPQKDPGRMYNDFSTHLPSFSHQVDDFFTLISYPTAFRQLRLSSSNAAINLGTMAVADSAHIKTTNAEILSKRFAVSTTFHAETSNGKLTLSEFYGFNDGMHDDDINVTLKTSNAPITAIVLMATDRDDLQFNGNIQTTNGDLNCTFVNYLWSDGIFNLDAKNHKGAINVEVTPEFEGDFDLETSSLGQVVLDRTWPTWDPTGAGRERRIKKTKDLRDHVQGYMSWDGLHRHHGSIRALTSHSNVTMYC